MGEEGAWQAPDEAYVSRVQSSFAQQAMMQTLGVRLGEVTPGLVTLQMDHNPAFCQQNGYLHAGTITAVLDTACGYAAFTLMPAGSNVLSVEFKINLLAPGCGETFSFVGSVVKAGRTLSNVRGDAFAHTAGGVRKRFATMDGTMITMPSKA